MSKLRFFLLLSTLPLLVNASDQKIRAQNIARLQFLEEITQHCLCCEQNEDLPTIKIELLNSDAAYQHIKAREEMYFFYADQFRLDFKCTLSGYGKGIDGTQVFSITSSLEGGKIYQLEPRWEKPNDWCSFVIEERPN